MSETPDAHEHLEHAEHAAHAAAELGLAIPLSITVMAVIAAALMGSVRVHHCLCSFWTVMPSRLSCARASWA